MSDAKREIEDALGLPHQEEEVKIVKKEKEPIIISEPEDDKQKDYQYARAQLYDLVEKMQETLNDAMDVAAQSQHPRAFEVAFNGARNAADVVDKIADLHKKMKELDVEEQKIQQTNVQNNVYMSGSTEDLLKMLKEAKNDK